MERPWPHTHPSTLDRSTGQEDTFSSQQRVSHCCSKVDIHLLLRTKTPCPAGSHICLQFFLLVSNPSLSPGTWNSSSRRSRASLWVLHQAHLFHRRDLLQSLFLCFNPHTCLKCPPEYWPCVVVLAGRHGSVSRWGSSQVTPMC